MLDFALPSALFAELSDKFAARHRIFGLQKVLDELANGLLSTPPVKALAASRPVENPPVNLVDDDVGQIQNTGERLQFGGRSRRGHLKRDFLFSLQLGQTARRRGAAE